MNVFHFIGLPTTPGNAEPSTRRLPANSRSANLSLSVATSGDDVIRIFSQFFKKFVFQFFFIFLNLF
jgi:hypothetical protein